MKLSSGPPNLRTIFRNEKIVPKMSLASSCAERRVDRRGGFSSLVGASVMGAEDELEVEIGLEGGGPEEIGRSGCRAQRRE
jgi:hypothetical protein